MTLRRQKKISLTRIIQNTLLASLSFLSGNSPTPHNTPARPRSSSYGFFEPEEARIIVRNKVEYKRDLEVYGTTEYFASPKQTFERGFGDCEDFGLSFLGVIDPQYLPDGYPYLLYISTQNMMNTIETQIGIFDGRVVSQSYLRFREFNISTSHITALYFKNGKWGLGGFDSEFTVPRFSTLKEAAEYILRGYPGSIKSWGIQRIHHPQWREYHGNLHPYREWVIKPRELK